MDENLALQVMRELRVANVENKKALARLEEIGEQWAKAKQACYEADTLCCNLRMKLLELAKDGIRSQQWIEVREEIHKSAGGG